MKYRTSMQGIGKTQQLWIEEKLERVFEYIKEHQPITYTELMNNGGFRRNTLRERVNELKRRNKIFELDDFLFANPLSEEHKSIFLLKYAEMNKILGSSCNNLAKYFKKLEQKQPLRFKLACKLSGKISKHKHKFVKINSTISKCYCGMTRIKSQRYYPNPNQDSLKGMIAYFEYLKKKILGKEMIDYFENVIVNFNYLPRIEYEKRKSKYKEYDEYPRNPLGILKKYRERNGKLNEEKVLYEYKLNKYSNSIIGNCTHCKTKYQVRIRQFLASTLIYNDQLKEGKITHQTFKKLVNEERKKCLSREIITDGRY